MFFGLVVVDALQLGAELDIDLLVEKALLTLQPYKLTEGSSTISIPRADGTALVIEPGPITRPLVEVCIGGIAVDSPFSTDLWNVENCYSDIITRLKSLSDVNITELTHFDFDGLNTSNASHMCTHTCTPHMSASTCKKAHLCAYVNPSYPCGPGGRTVWKVWV